MTLAALMILGLVAQARQEKVMIYGDHGRLDAVIQTPETQPGHKIPMVIICHGFTGNKDELLLRTLADSLERQGVGSIRFDFNGHGRSDGLFEQMTVPNEIVDTKHVLEYVEHLDYVNRIALAGHSQGGVVAAMTGGELGNGRIDALVLLAPAGVLRDDALRGNTFGKIYDPKNPPETIELWGGRKLGGNYIRTAIGLPIYETAMHYTGPTLVIHGESDRTVPYTYGQRFHYVIKGSEFRLMPDMDHGFSRHEAEVAGMAARFLADRLGASPKAFSATKSKTGKTTDSINPRTIKGADASTYETLGGGYSRDKNHAYYNGRLISDAWGGNHFVYKSGGYATDGVHTYYNGRPVERN